VRLAAGALVLAALAATGAGPERPAKAQPAAARSCHAAEGAAYVPAGEVLLGEDGPGRPGRRVAVAAFWIDRHEVTNRQFAAFVAATGYRSQAELQGAGAVFTHPEHVDGLDDPAQWWRLVRGADWRHPRGPGSEIGDRMQEPVVQVTFADAQAYARWAGRALPSEAQWERAARGDQSGEVAPSAWAYDGEGEPIANTWQGVFPVLNTKADGYAGLAPVGCFKPNALGLYDMIGNAWEWTTKPSDRGRVVKGGSFLCAFDYCANFRPAGWQAQEADLPTSHIGFRTISLTPPRRSPA